MVARRMLLIVAILMGITALTAGLAAPPRPRPPVVTPAPQASAGSGGGEVLVRRTLGTGATKPRTVAVEEGDHLILTVRADDLDSVDVEGLDQVAAVAPDTPAVFDLLLDRPGSYPVVLAGAGERLGTVRVTPREE